MTAATRESTFALEGVSCPACVFRIEEHLKTLDGVIQARGNATRRRLRLVWEPGRQDEASLVRAIQTLGYDAHSFAEQADASEPSLLPRLAVAALGMMNIMGLSISVWAGAVTDMGPGTTQFMHWLSALIALPVTVYSGSVFYLPALRAIRVGRMTMDTPIAIAIWVTFVASLVETVRGAHHVYFDAVVSLIFLLLIGRVLEQSLRRRSGDTAANLRDLLAVPAFRLAPDGTLAEVDPATLRPGDRILVQSGGRVPADGQLAGEEAWIDESALTGEAAPRRIGAGGAIPAGAVITIGPAVLEITQSGGSVQLMQMSRMLEEAAAHKGRVQLLADRFAQSYVPLVLIGGAAGFALWFGPLGASFGEALMIAVAVLVVTCPCAAGLATPAVTTRAVNLLLRDGVLIKSGEALEKLGEVDRIYVDKTGTLSEPHIAVDRAVPDALLAGARRLAAASGHPLARALGEGCDAAPATAVREHPGQGIEAADGARLGTAAFVGLAEAAATPAIYYRAPGGEIARFTFSESPVTGARAAIRALAPLQITLLSGDGPHPVGAFAQRVGIETWQARQSPLEKLQLLQAERDRGGRALMVGDGINDSGALSAAHVSASFASATQIAQAAADVLLLRSDLMLLPRALRLARRARWLIAQNLWFSTAYNVLTVPLALMGYLSPMLAALLMSSSSILVLLNGLRLRAAP
ncbi:MAG: cation-translocating P-type ATPase [Pseudomonadota bacterium]